MLSAISSLMMKMMAELSKGDADIGLMITLILTATVACAYLFWQRGRTLNVVSNLKPKLAGVLAAISLISVLNWLLWNIAIRSAANPAYVHSVANLDVVGTIVLSAIFFGRPMTRQAWLGLAVTMLGTYLIVSPG